MTKDVDFLRKNVGRFMTFSSRFIDSLDRCLEKVYIINTIPHGGVMVESKKHLKQIQFCCLFVFFLRGEGTIRE